MILHTQYADEYYKYHLCNNVKYLHVHMYTHVHVSQVADSQTCHSGATPTKENNFCRVLYDIECRDLKHSPQLTISANTLHL